MYFPLCFDIQVNSTTKDSGEDSDDDSAKDSGTWHDSGKVNTNAVL
jgi:hypothetical protein